MKMKKIFFCLLLVNLPNLKTYCQDWFEGSLVLSNCEVLVGEISVTPEYDLVLFSRDETRMVYPAHKIKSVFFYDVQTDINRKYISLKSDDGIRSSYHLYEIVVAGDVDILRRKKSDGLSGQTDVIDFNYFIQYNSQLISLKKFKRKVYPQLKLRVPGQLEKFIALNQLCVNTPASAIRIIKYYNSLGESEGLLARN
jgi:hypothetical protein